MNYSVERYNYSVVRELAITNNGIIFGGYLRDRLIYSHYTKLFLKSNSYKKENYWNKDYHKSSSLRTLIPKDIDIYFQYKDNMNDFLRKLKYDSIKIENIEGSPYIPFLSIVNYKKVVMTINDVKINIDILYPINEEKIMEPPFNTLDMTCNAFIEDKYGMRISENTGTILDSIKDKNNMEEKIKKQIVQLKTEITSENKTKIEERYLLNRIIKMVERKWVILNLPFKAKRNITDNTKDCYICNCRCKLDQKIIMLNKLTYHEDCLYEFLKFQMQQHKYNFFDLQGNEINFLNLIPSSF